MPPHYVTTIEEEIFYEYAKLISRSAFEGRINYPFVSDRFKAFKSRAISMSGAIREWQREQELPRACVFCGTDKDLTTDHLIPRHRGGSDDPDNLVLSCQSCNSSRGEKGIFEWLGPEKKDHLHRLVAGKYLKELHALHKIKGTLTKSIAELETLCKECRNPKTCEEWRRVATLGSTRRSKAPDGEEKAGELTCLCLECVF
jgi:5-methylcytosine-specific restriction endonuclease McrA